MGTVTVRLNDEEQARYNEFAKLHNVPVSTLFKQALDEHIEDVYDLQVTKDYIKRKEAGELVLYDWDEAMEMMDAED